MEQIINSLMEQHPVTKLIPKSKDHARHAIEQALVVGKIEREEYNQLLGYIIFVLYKEKKED